MEFDCRLLSRRTVTTAVRPVQLAAPQSKVQMAAYGHVSRNEVPEAIPSVTQGLSSLSASV